MQYDDDATKQSEERFQEKLRLVREGFNLVEPKELIEMLFNLDSYLNELRAKENRTEEEDLKLEELTTKQYEMAVMVINAKKILGENLLRNAKAIYENAKKLAAEGDEKAKAIYEDLRPKYEQMLQEQLANRAN